MKKLIAFLLILFATESASHGYTRITTRAGNSPRWLSMPIRYSISEAGYHSITNGSDFEAVHAAFQTWQNVSTADIRFEYLGRTAKGDAERDGANVVTFTADTSLLGSGTLAAAFLFYHEEGSEAVMDEVDILFNSSYEWTTSGARGQFDIQSTMTHEIGHLLGLDHSGLLSSVMAPYGAPDEIDDRMLQYDDIAGVTEIYPGTVPHLGKIAGSIMLSGFPVFGAHVVAVDAGGTPLVSTLSLSDGSYVLGFLPGGSYRVYAEPLDFPVSDLNIGGMYQDVNTDFGTTYSGDTWMLDQARSVQVFPNAPVSVENINVLPHSATGLNITRPGSARRVVRGMTTSVRLEGHDLSAGVLWSSSSSTIAVGAASFRRDSRSAIAPTSASIGLTVAVTASPGPKNIAVNRGTDAAVASGIIVVVDPLPTIRSFDPSFGSSDGGTDITIRGSNFRPGIRVYFGGLPSPSVTWVDSTTLTAVTPTNSPGGANIQLVNLDGTNAVTVNSYAYLLPNPVISEILPFAGPPETIIRILGIFFDPNPENIEVYFSGGVKARVTGSTFNRIVVIVPQGAKSGPLTVTVLGKTVTGSNFTVTDSTRVLNRAPDSNSFTNISGGGVKVPSLNDAVVSFPLAFDFRFFDSVYLAGTQISVTTNGWMSFDPVTSVENKNGPLSGTAAASLADDVPSTPPTIIAPFFDDLVMVPGVSAMDWAVLGGSERRRMVIQWTNMSSLDENGRDLNARLTFQIILFEGSYDIQFVYGPMSGPRSDGSSATVGMRDTRSAASAEVSYNQLRFRSDSYVTFRFEAGYYTSLDSSPEPTTNIHSQMLPLAMTGLSEDYFTGIALLAPSAMSVTLKVLDFSGVMILGPGVRNPVSVTIEAGQPYTKLLSDLFGIVNKDGWIRLEPSAPGLRAYYTVGNSDRSNWDGGISTPPATDFIAFHHDASVYVTNVSSRPATVTVTEFATGRRLTSTVPAGRGTGLWIPSASRIRSSEPLVSVEAKSSSEGLALSMPPPVSAARSSLVFPHAASGAGYTSTLTLVNVEAFIVEASISFGTSSRLVQLAANSALVTNLRNRSTPLDSPFPPSPEEIVADSVRVTSVGAGGGRLLGVLTIATEDSIADIGSPDAATEVYFPHVAQGDGMYTGLAIASGDQAATVTIEVYGASGDAPKSTVLTVEANKQIARVLSELIPSVTIEMGGYIHIRSDRPIWAWVIYGSDGAMASGQPL